jgi:hypothetical protein
MAFTTVTDLSVGHALDADDWAEIQDGFDNTWALIDSTVLSADASSVDITSIAADWTHLMVQAYMRSAHTSTFYSDDVLLRFNGSSSAEYDYEYLQGGNTSLTAAEGRAQSSILAGLVPSDKSASDLFGPLTIWIPNYASTAGHKNILATSGADTGGNGILAFTSVGFWRSTSAITEITLLFSSDDVLAGSRVSLFGLA